MLKVKSHDGSMLEPSVPTQNFIFSVFLYNLIFLNGEFQIYPRMDFDNILYVEYLSYNNYKN